MKTARFFFLLQLVLKCSALKRKNNSAEAFTELRRCHCVWGKPELWGGCLSTVVLSLCSDLQNEKPSHGWQERPRVCHDSSLGAGQGVKAGPVA